MTSFPALLVLWPLLLVALLLMVAVAAIPFLLLFYVLAWMFSVAVNAVVRRPQ